MLAEPKSQERKLFFFQKRGADQILESGCFSFLTEGYTSGMIVVERGGFIMNMIRLIGSVFICQLAGIIGGIFTQSSVQSWYITLRKPVFNPPAWLFGPVWIFLYLVMGLALYLIWSSETRNRARDTALLFFFIQLGLNILWSFLFFYLKNPLLGFIEILILLVFIAITAWKFYQLNHLAGFLFIPYMLWVGFASVLNFFLWLLNR
jgi:tryptophan-rich sensory protein